MVIVSNSGCLNRIPDTDYSARADCLLTISRGDVYFYESGFSLFSGWSIGFVVAAYVAIWSISDHPKLRHAQKWGYALGLIGALPIFLPLYLIFAPAREGEPVAATPEDRSAP